MATFESRGVRRDALAALALLLASARATAQTWPDRAQRCVVPFPAGGVLGALVRTVPEPLQASWGESSRLV